MQEIVDNLKSTYNKEMSKNEGVPDVKIAINYLEKICNTIINEGDGTRFKPGEYAYIAIKMILDEFKKGIKTEPIHEIQDYIRLLRMAASSAYLRLHYEYNV